MNSGCLVNSQFQASTSIVKKSLVVGCHVEGENHSKVRVLNMVMWFERKYFCYCVGYCSFKEILFFRMLDNVASKKDFFINLNIN